MTRPEPFRVEGIDYTPEGIEYLRGDLVAFRDHALTAGAMEHAVLLSHTIALLAYLIELLRGRD
jgi:hypothetical protein